MTALANARRFSAGFLLCVTILAGCDKFPPPGYQGYDKAMDMFYLSVAYLSVLRNWTSRPAFQVARFLQHVTGHPRSGSFLLSLDPSRGSAPRIYCAECACCG